jgi:hypothetical protein
MAIQSHPAPHRHRVSSPMLLFAVLGAATAWSIQLLVDYALAAHHCFPTAMPLITATIPGGWVYPLVAAFNIAAIMLAILSTLTARTIWNRTKEEHDSPPHHLLSAGEGRTRFLAMCGQLAGLGFLAAIVFDTPAIYMVPRCFG